MRTVCLLLPAFFLAVFSDTSLAESPRSAKIRTILLLQDQRRGNDPRWAGFFADGDEAVRERALLACANIQDTLLMPGLLERLRDQSAAVREAAAFAVGQTGGGLSSAGQVALETQCLGLLTGKDSPPRLIEEMGKFGTVASLSQLAERSPSFSAKQTESLVRAIARYAIRGVVSEPSTHFLITLAEMPPNVSWEPIYALQRIAPRLNIRIEQVIPLAEHKDPLVRMNAAALLGKLPGTPVSSALLARLSSRDPDWRVRVNATKAMGSAGSRSDSVVMRQFVKAFSDSNEHVALSALTSYGEMLKGTDALTAEADTRLWKIAENRESGLSMRRRAEAMTALAKIKRSGAYRRLAAIHISDDWLLARCLIAIGETGDTLGLPLLLQSRDAAKPLIASSALEGLQHLAEQNPRSRVARGSATSAALQALGSRDISVLSSAAAMLEDSLLRTVKAVPSLLHALKRLREPDDTEAMQQIIQSLGTMRDRRAYPHLASLLSQGCGQPVADAALRALHVLSGKPYNGPLRVNAGSGSSSVDTAYLSRLPDTVLVRMETSAGSLTLELYPKIAPATVTSFLKLMTKGYFDRLMFHRVVPNFVIQGGDPRGDGWGGPGYAIRSEFSLLRYERGTLGMASAGKDTEGSQFFVTHSPQPHLDGRYTIFGRVRSGMETVDQIQVGDTIMNVTTDRAQATSD